MSRQNHVQRPVLDTCSGPNFDVDPGHACIQTSQGASAQGDLCTISGIKITKGHATNKKHIWMWIIRPYQAQAARLWSPAGWWAATNPASQHGQIMVSVPWLILATRQRLGIADRLSTCGKKLHQQTNRPTQPRLSWVPGSTDSPTTWVALSTHNIHPF